MTTITSVPFFKHGLGQEELDSLEQVLKGSILTTGEYVREFEQEFAKLVGAQHAVGVTSCTGGLHISLVALGVGPGDEVITTPMTFIATATSILEAGATPVFVDIEPETGNMDTSKIKAAITSKTKAIIPVHLYGQMCDMKAIKRIADEHGLFIIEDAAHCVEGMRDGVQPGQLSDTACFSFYATKNLTCGEGGAVVTNSDELREKLILLRSHGMNKTAADRAKEGYKHWDMVMLGWKYNMDNIQAAILLPQLRRLEGTWQKRDRLVKHYENRLANIPSIRRPRTVENVKHAYHLLTVLVPPEQRDHIINGLQQRGISVMVNYRAIHLLTYFKETMGSKPGDYPLAENFGDSILSLPFYPEMSTEQIDFVASSLAQVARH